MYKDGQVGFTQITFLAIKSCNHSRVLSHCKTIPPEAAAVGAKLEICLNIQIILYACMRRYIDESCEIFLMGFLQRLVYV